MIVASHRALRRALALPLVLAAGAACSKDGPPTVAPIPVTVARVEQGTVPFELSATGTVEPLKTVAVESQVGGILTHVAFREGDEVAQGQVLFQIDPRPYQAALQQAQAVLARDQAQQANAEADVQRYEALAKQDYVTAQQYEQVKTTAAASRATVAADEAAVQNARLNLQYATIRAPISGRAGSLLVREGNLVKANGGPLVTINQIHPILVRFSVPASNLPIIRQYGDSTLPVRAHAAAVPEGSASSGSLSFIDNAVDTATGTILLKGRFDNRDNALWPGEFVNVTLRLFQQPNAIVIPSQAVVEGQQGNYVFVITPNATAAQRPITISRTAGELTVVEKGLNPGEQVVTDGQLRLTTGTKVQVKAAANGEQQRAG